MKKSKAVLVAVSTLALNMAATVPVFAQVVISCPQTLRIGSHAACSSGSLVINPDGTTDLTGCLVTTVAPVEGRCFISTGGVAPTRSVVVDFTQIFVNLKNGGENLRIDNFRMLHTGTTTPATKFTFPAVDVINTVTVDIGGTIDFTDGQALGGYSGEITVRADVI